MVSDHYFECRVQSYFSNYFVVGCSTRQKHAVVCEQFVAALTTEGNVSPKKAESLTSFDGFWNRVCRRYFDIMKPSVNQVKSLYDFWRRDRGKIFPENFDDNETGLNKSRLVPSRFSCFCDDWWEGLSEFALHQGKEGRKTRRDVTVVPPPQAPLRAFPRFHQWRLSTSLEQKVINLATPLLFIARRKVKLYIEGNNV